MRGAAALALRASLLLALLGGLAATSGDELTAACDGAGEAGDSSDQPSLLQSSRAASGDRKQQGLLAGREPAECGEVRRRRRQSTCGCRRRVGVSGLEDRNVACIGDEITTMPRDEDGFINLTVMLEWVYQEPIIANLMNLPAVACQDRAKTFFNCQVLQPNESMSIESTMPYYIYAVLGTQAPSNWENLRNVMGTFSKVMGPIAIVSGLLTGGVSTAAYVAFQQVVQKEVTHAAKWGIGKWVGDEGVETVAQNITETLNEEVPQTLSAWSTLLGPGEKYLKIVGGLGGDVEQESPNATAMQVVEITKEEFAELKVTAILPER